MPPTLPPPPPQDDVLPDLHDDRGVPEVVLTTQVLSHNNRQPLLRVVYPVYDLRFFHHTLLRGHPPRLQPGPQGMS